jgi:light-regulated signal transduction histidine kinase (bacteriophytochrome)
MSQLIDDLLAFSRLGRKSIQKSNLNMDDLIESALVDISKTTEHKAKIVVSPLHPVVGDYALLNQVFVNLISNAIKYSSKKSEPLVEIFSKKSNGEVTFTVKDNGDGFDMKYADKLFGVFQRLHTPEEFDGTGVGLAIVHRVIAKHGGKVWGTGEPGKGATFSFTLPAT